MEKLREIGDFLRFCGWVCSRACEGKTGKKWLKITPIRYVIESMGLADLADSDPGHGMGKNGN